MGKPSRPEVKADSDGIAGRDIAAAVAASVLSALPVFLVAALAGQIRDTLEFGVAALGALFSMYYLSAAVASVPASRMVEALGALRSMRLGVAVTGGLLLLLAAVVHSYRTLAALMVLIGPVSALLQPATNLFLIRRIPDRRRGAAFGLKQAAVPTAVAISGFAVPTIGLTLGWRWAFVIAGGLALIIAVFMPRSLTSLASYRQREPIPGLERRQVQRLIVITAGFALAVSAAAALSSFAVTALSATGLSASRAGILAALGGLIAGATRVGVGFGADRSRSSHMTRVIVMLVAGACAYAAVALATSTIPGLLLPALAVAFAAGWGWNGLFSLAIATAHPSQAARATGLTSVGGRVGGVIGPLVFGLVASRSSYASAWLVAAGAALSGAIIMAVGRYLWADAE